MVTKNDSFGDQLLSYPQTILFGVSMVNVLNFSTPLAHRHENITYCYAGSEQGSKKPICLFVCFVALRPKSTAMVIAGRSIHLNHTFPGQA